MYVCIYVRILSLLLLLCPGREEGRGLRDLQAGKGIMLFLWEAGREEEGKFIRLQAEE
jgi:hypothetical protein